MNFTAISGQRSSGGDISWPLRRAARLYPSSEAIIVGERSFTYAELAKRVDTLGAALDHLAIPIGGRVGVLGGNSLAHIECCLGVPAFGRVLVDLNFRLAEEELAFMVADCGLELLVVDEHQLDVGRSLRALCPSLRQLVLDAPGSCPADCLAYESLVNEAPAIPPEIEEHALAAISYTGGTTGTPKGVMLSHADMLANARHNLIATGHTHADRWLHVCPMFHVARTANVFACTWVGATQLVLPRFAAGPVVEAIEAHAITHTNLVPTMVRMLLDEGYLYLIDRLKDMIVTGAENVYSIEVENALLEHSAVIEAAVFGVAHPQWGEAVHRWARR